MMKYPNMAIGQLAGSLHTILMASMPQWHCRWLDSRVATSIVFGSHGMLSFQTSIYNEKSSPLLKAHVWIPRTAHTMILTGFKSFTTSCWIRAYTMDVKHNKRSRSSLRERLHGKFCLMRRSHAGDTFVCL